MGKRKPAPGRVFTIEAEYRVAKILRVLVAAEGDPTDSDNWLEVLDEEDSDCALQSVLSATEE